jgi:Cu(I)/Ag(I) efflux system membrane fusion protein
MSRFPLLLACLAIVVFALGLGGCGPAESTPSEPAGQGPDEEAAGSEHQHDEDEGHAHDEDEGHAHDEDEGHAHDEDEGHAHDEDEGHAHDEGALADLSEADRALAEKQKVCLVSGEPFGEMDTPVKITYQGRDIFVCCNMCKKKFDADPEKYLAKLPE